MRADGPRRGMGPGVGPPDGGWGWVVLAACFVVTGFAYGFPKAVSVFFRSLMRDFGAGYSDTAWVSSIMLAMLYGTVPASASGVCLPSGTPHSAASPAGLGLALNFQPSLIMRGLYFERRRPLANGLAAAEPHTSGDAPGAVEADGARRNLHETPPSGRGRLLEVAVCTDRAFIVYVVTKFLMALGLFVPAILLVNYAKDAGVPDADAAFLLSIVGFVDIVARPAALAGLPRLRPHVPYLFSLALLANGLTDLGSARARSYGALVAFCVVFGLSYGTVGALQFEVLMAAVGAPRFPSALGLVLLVEAVAVLIGPPSAGHLVDALKNYEIIFYLAGSEVALAGVFMAMATCCLRHQSHSLEASAGGAQPVTLKTLRSGEVCRPWKC
ncbi:Monocarboxylate transporter 3 [Heterocephalus glaber]|uniref:Monocarboxylate transporter 3 n=1 Tax=Heterocephalus glaber TaxID=10181 RepID=G5AYS4_HETGA|nr:Monocarboxylate transporter 3 [Heterocephalus glaber]